MTGNSVPSSDAIFRPEEEVIAQYIEDGADLIHIFGEPGVGKTTVLDHIEKEFEDDVGLDRRNLQANHSLNELFRKLFMHSLMRYLRERRKKAGSLLA